MSNKVLNKGAIHKEYFLLKLKCLAFTISFENHFAAKVFDLFVEKFLPISVLILSMNY